MMTSTLQVVSFGNELGIVLSQDLLRRYGLKSGDDVQLIETPRGFELTSNSMKAMAAARKIMRENTEVLSRLAE